MTESPARSSTSIAFRVRFVLAAVGTVAALLAISALYKAQTCTCDGPGVSYEAIAAVAAAVTAIALTVYAGIARAGGDRPQQ